MHGNFSRADTMNFMAVIGPGFKTKFVHETPTSNADVGRTDRVHLGLFRPSKGPLLGRVMSEALPDGKAPTVTAQTVRSPAANGLIRTVLKPFAAGDRTV